MKQNLKNPGRANKPSSNFISVIFLNNDLRQFPFHRLCAQYFFGCPMLHISLIQGSRVLLSLAVDTKGSESEHLACILTMRKTES